MTDPEMCLQPIGFVRNEVRELASPHPDWSNLVSEIVVSPELAEGLEGLEEFSHIEVLYWFHRVTEPPQLKVHPQRRADLPLVGVFASRAPVRPNHIALSTARLIERRGNILTVKGLDALDGSPVVDIKPRLPEKDTGDFRVPEWVSRL